MKILFAGLGSIGQRHLRNIVRVMGGEVDISAVRTTRNVPVLSEDMMIVDGANLADTYNIKEFDDLDPALDQRPDVVFVTNPSSMHLSTAAAAIRAGCDVFLEKPMSSDNEGVDELIELASKQNARVLVGYQFRFHPALKDIKVLLEHGSIGHITSAQMVNAEYLPGWHPYEDYSKSYAARQELGGGVLLSQIHSFDVAYWLFGMPRDLYAVGGHLSTLNVDVEDSVSVLMNYCVEKGSLPVSLHFDYLQKPLSRTMTIVGDKGRIDWNAFDNILSVHRHDEKEPAVTDYSHMDRNQMFLDQTEHFLRVLRDEEKPSVGLKDAAVSLRMALAAKKSMAEGGLVQLDKIT